MCGRFALSAKTSDIEKLRPDITIPDDFKQRYNIAPSQKISVQLNDGSNEIKTVRWGLIPSWSKDESIGYKLINARAETISEKPSFRIAFKNRRCLIFSDGFYEWKTITGSKQKQPHLIRLKTQEVFAFAGLWEIWKNNEGELIKTATIITTEPNELMQTIHNRMPVILKKELLDYWLDGDNLSGLIDNCLLPYPSDEMEAFPVSTAVNSPSNDSPDCIMKLVV